MDLTRADPVKLRHFMAVLDTGSFARAAEENGISQPAISKSIRALEEAAGMRLFERGRAGARPTDYAALLAAHARIILAEYSLAEAELRAMSKANVQEIAIGCSLSLAQSLLPRAIARFRRRWPAVALSVEVGLSTPLLGKLLHGDLDLVVSAPEEGVGIDNRLTRTFLLEEQDALVVGANHPLLAKPVITVADLLDYPWIVPRQSTRLDRIHAVFARHRLPPPATMLRSESGELARGLLREEPFICLIGDTVLAAEIAAGQLAILPDLGFTASRMAFLSTRRSAHARGPARNLALLLKQMAGEGN